MVAVSRNWRSLGETKGGNRNFDKLGTNQLSCFGIATTSCYHLQPSTQAAIYVFYHKPPRRLPESAFGERTGDQSLIFFNRETPSRNLADLSRSSWALLGSPATSNRLAT